MSDNQRIRMVSQSSSSSSDSSCLDPAYAIVDLDSSQHLLLGRKASGHHEGEKSSSRHGSVAVVSLALSVVCLLILAGILVWFCLLVYSSDGFPGRLSNQEKVCMPCGQISPNPLAAVKSPAIRELDTYWEDETEICCASTPAQYATMFKLILKRQEEVKKLADIMGNGDDGQQYDHVRSGKAVSAHLLTKPTKPHDKLAQHIQQWKSPAESPVSHVRGGLQFHNNSLYVHSEGLYFVYCQILFNRAHSKETPEAEDASANRLASHYVRRQSLLYPASSGMLLKARHTRVSGEDDRHSSYVGGLFFLHTGDQIFVQVSVPELVSHDDRASFFGLFKVGN